MFSSSLTPLTRTIVFVIALVLMNDRVHADHSFEAVRPITRILADTLDDLYRTSPTARGVIDELEQSDLIIHVLRMDLIHQHRFLGTMRFVHAAGGRRFLRVTINERLPPNRRAAALAHELQHALEVARATHVMDNNGLSALYRVIGRPSGDDPNAECYETEAAQHVGMRVLADYRARITATNSSH